MVDTTTAFLGAVEECKRDLRPEEFRIVIDDIQYPVSPEMIAEVFTCMDMDQQARFYNHVDRVASSWHGAGWEFQLQAITDSEALTLAGRRVMQSIGEYSHWGVVPKCDRRFLDGRH